MLTFLLEHAKTRGLHTTMREILCRLCRLTPCPQPARPAPLPPSQEVSLGLQPRELVEVRSRSEILASLDQHGKNKGLLLIPEMLQYSGRRFRVHKRVEKIFLEESKQLRRMKNTVLLEGVMCDGAAMKCDRSCFYYWREAWLRRVPDSSAGDYRSAGGPQR